MEWLITVGMWGLWPLLVERGLTTGVGVAGVLSALALAIAIWRRSAGAGEAAPRWTVGLFAAAFAALALSVVALELVGRSVGGAWYQTRWSKYAVVTVSLICGVALGGGVVRAQRLRNWKPSRALQHGATLASVVVVLTAHFMFGRRVVEREVQRFLNYDGPTLHDMEPK